MGDGKYAWPEQYAHKAQKRRPKKVKEKRVKERET